MTAPWPTTEWEIIKRYDAETTDGPFVLLAGFTVCASDEVRADTTADVLFRMLLTQAGVPWQGRVE